MEYKSVNKYINKNNKKSRNVNNFFIKLLICIVIVLSLLTFIKYDKNGKQVISKYLYKNNISMATINNWYKKHFGDILPFQSIVKEKTKLVFNNSLEYKSMSIYKDGIKLNVDSNYLIPAIESGIVIFKGNKDDYGNTVIIEQTDGVTVWYGNVDNANVSLYDYVSKGEYVGEAKDKYFYMVFQKNGKMIKYNEYLK